MNTQENLRDSVLVLMNIDRHRRLPEWERWNMGLGDRFLPALLKAEIAQFKQRYTRDEVQTELGSSFDWINAHLGLYDHP